MPAADAPQVQRPPFGGMGPESNAPGNVTVCACESLLIHVTSVPVGTETLPGSKLFPPLSPLMEIVSCPLTGPVLWHPTQATAAAARIAARVALRVMCSMKSASFVSRSFLPGAVAAVAVALAYGGAHGVAGDTLGLIVRYPSEGARIAAVARSFVFGSASPGSTVTVNGTPALVARSGGWIAYVPFSAGRFALHVRAQLGDAIVAADRIVDVDDGAVPAFPSMMTIVRAGDELPLAVHAPSAARVVASGPGFHDVVLTADATLGPDAYSATIKATSAAAGPSPVTYAIENRDGSSSRVVSSSSLAVAARPYLFVGRVVPYTPDAQSGARPYGMLAPTADAQTDFTVPLGTPLVVTGQQGDELRVALGSKIVAWIDRRELAQDYGATAPPNGDLLGRSCRDDPRETICTLRFTSRLPIRIDELDARGAVARAGLTVRYFGARRCDECAVSLKLEQNTLWGYRPRWVANNLVISVRKPPAMAAPPRPAVTGLLVVIDPGHGPDSGAVGPVETIERDVNLDIARRLSAKLQALGARTVLTREGSAGPPLYDRPALAQSLRADVLISVHNNAPPDGVDPSAHHGYSVYYFQAHSRALAQALHDAYARHTDLPDEGLYRGDLALVRTPELPAVLTESAFITWPPEEMKLRDADFRDGLADTMADGMERWAEAQRSTIFRSSPRPGAVAASSSCMCRSRSRDRLPLSSTRPARSAAAATW